MCNVSDGIEEEFDTCSLGWMSSLVLKYFVGGLTVEGVLYLELI